MRTEYKAVLFDFDGVLTLDETGSQSICNYVCAAAGIDKDTFRNEYKKYNVELLTGRIKHENVWEKICGAAGSQIEIKILYDSFINTPINSEMLGLAQALKKKRYKIGMVTDNKADRIRSIIDYHRWHGLFDGVAISAEVGSEKNQEHIFLKIFQTLAVEPEACIFIDNNENNLVVPRNLGVTTIFFDYWKNDVAGLKKELMALGIEL